MNIEEFNFMLKNFMEYISINKNILLVSEQFKCQTIN